MISGLRYTVRQTGFLSLYRGLAPTLLGSVPKAGIRFGLNSVIKDKLRDPTTGQLTPGKNFVAGLGAGVSEALIIVAPVETVKTKCIQLNLPFVKGLKQIVRTQGLVKGVYQGAMATALKQGSNQGLRFMWFNEYKRIVTDDGQKPMTPLLGLFGGMSAGCFSTLGNNPFDVVKTRSEYIISRWFGARIISCQTLPYSHFSYLCHSSSHYSARSRRVRQVQIDAGLFSSNFGRRRRRGVLRRSRTPIRTRRTRTGYYFHVVRNHPTDAGTQRCVLSIK